jgi:hypothetical protein
MLLPCTGEATHCWLRLSAYLAEATQNKTFLDGARQSGAFILSTFGITRPGNGILQIENNDTVICPSSHDLSEEDLTEQAAGLFLEGLAFLPDDTMIDSKRVDEM